MAARLRAAIDESDRFLSVREDTVRESHPRGCRHV